ncbi:class I adenylate-forming enzyme family protein [Nocardia sp. CA-135953]|uniref:class I adenylate-forming enzyme family protein n=1 Tax=Nocardia sp. CA-135953 TaxID=3239978 RepID=UPI003D96A224
MPTIPELIRAAVAAHRESVAVVDGDRTATFGAVGERTIRLANALNGLSDIEDGRVAILMRNRLEYVEADLAIARAGRVKVPINPKLSDDERAFVIDDSEADIVLTESSELDRVRNTIGDRKVQVISVDGPAAGVHGYEEILASASMNEPVLEPNSERLSQFLYTSGTTGRPKGAMLLDRCRVSATTMSLVEEFAVTPSDGMIHAGPLSHGSASKLLTFFVRGARNIVIPKFEPEIFLRAVRESGGTSSFVVPTMIQMLVEHAHTDPTTNAWGLRNLTYGGASMSRQTLDAAAEVLGGVVTQVYGSCEAPHPVLALRHREQADPRLPGRDVVPAGYPALGVDVRLVDENGADAAADNGVRTGELWVRGPNVMVGYWRRPEATAESLVDGWYRTGDVVSVDGDGLYTLVDRVKDIVITGGLNVYPAEVERVLRELPGVAETAVVGIPDEKWGELVTAVIVPRSPEAVDEDTVMAWVREKLAGYKKPRRVLLVDDLPKGSTGKILKREVRELATQRRGQLERTD